MLWANCAKVKHGKENKFWYPTMVTCYGFRLLFTIVLTKALHKLLPKKLVHSLSFSRCSYYFECFEKINFHENSLIFTSCSYTILRTTNDQQWIYKIYTVNIERTLALTFWKSARKKLYSKRRFASPFSPTVGGFIRFTHLQSIIFMFSLNLETNANLNHSNTLVHLLSF